MSSPPSPSPLLTHTRFSTGQLRSGQVVSYVGFVSDSFDPEVFCGTYVDGEGNTHASKYRDCLPPGCVPGISGPLEERNVYYLVPIPGEAAWIRNARVLEAGGGGGGDAMITLGTPMHHNNTHKRMLDGGDDHHELQDPFQSPHVTNNGNDDGHTLKRTHQQQDIIDGHATISHVSPPKLANTSSIHDGTERLANLPMDNETECPVVLKTYSEHGTLSLHDMVRVVGVLCIDPDMYGGVMGAGNENDIEDSFQNGSYRIPCSVAPRLHAISVERLSVSSPWLSCGMPASLITPQQCRGDLVNLFTRIWDGDKLLAEYLLLWCMAGRAARVDEMTLIGKLSLCVLGTSPHCARWSQELFTLLFPRLQIIPLTQPVLTNKLFVPSKGPEDNRVRAGRLQMACGTRCVIDETTLIAGTQLDEIGLANLRSLQQLAQQQTVTYEFPFCSQQIPVDAPCLVLSPNRTSSLVHGDLSVLWRGLGGPPPVGTFFANQEQEASIRRYVEDARCHMMSNTLSLSQDTAELIQKDFVECRARGDKIDQDDLHIWINTARAIAVSFGKSTIDIDSYGRARALDAERKSRMGVGGDVAAGS